MVLCSLRRSFDSILTHTSLKLILHSKIEEENVFQQIYADAFGITTEMNRIYINPRLLSNFNPSCSDHIDSLTQNEISTAVF